MGERLSWRLFTKTLVLEVVGKNMKSAISARAGHADARRGRGRPPKFNRDVALRQTIKLFWEHGFEGTSTDDLEAAPAERAWAALAQPLRPACIKASRLGSGANLVEATAGFKAGLFPAAVSTAFQTVGVLVL